MKKATRKLIPALAMLLISAVLMSTASFAWFSMNKTVTATGMSVTAKADQTFLVISNQAGQSTNTSITATASNGSATLFPAAFGSISTNGTITWKTGYSNDIDSATAAGALSDIPTSDVDKYVLSNTFYIRAASGTVDATNLKLTGVTVTSDSAFKDAVSVVVAVGNSTNTYVNGTLTNTDALSATVTSAEDIVVHVYIYINGDHSSVKTANATAANLVGMNVAMTFGVA